MKIAIYTATSSSIFDQYNIAKVIEYFPNAEICIIAVKSKSHSFFQKLKTILVEYRDGHNHFKSDSLKLNKELKRLVKSIQIPKINPKLVDEVNDVKSEQILKKFNPDFIIQSGAGILKKNIFTLAKKHTLNVHHGFAPEIRGMNSTFWCLFYGITDLIGVTCHLIDEKLDTGNVIFQYQYPLKKEKNFIEIQKTLCVKGAELLIQSILYLDQNTSLEFKESIVNSYYFSNLDYRKYNCLKKNNFNTLADSFGIKQKRLIKKTLV